MEVRINVNGPFEDREVSKHIPLTMVEDGTAYLASTLVDAVNAILRSFDLPANVAVVTRSSEALYRMRTNSNEVGN